MTYLATSAVISFGFIISIFNTGGVIIGLHDLADILLYATKLLHYCKQPDWTVTTTFVSFAVTFFVTRIILFPLVVYLHYTVSAYPVAISTFIYILLVAIYMMHVYWFSLIVKMIKKTVSFC